MCEKESCQECELVDGCFEAYHCPRCDKYYPINSSNRMRVATSGTKTTYSYECICTKCYEEEKHEN